jgi:hypothetical protein
MSDTPKTDAKSFGIVGPNMPRRHMVVDADFAMDMELKVRELRHALLLCSMSCEHLHHDRRHFHESGEPCPVEAIVRKAAGLDTANKEVDRDE